MVIRKEASPLGLPTLKKNKKIKIKIKINRNGEKTFQMTKNVKFLQTENTKRLGYNSIK